MNGFRSLVAFEVPSYEKGGQNSKERENATMETKASFDIVVVACFACFACFQITQGIN